jgi:hypothetical protein
MLSGKLNFDLYWPEVTPILHAAQIELDQFSKMAHSTESCI